MLWALRTLQTGTAGFIFHVCRIIPIHSNNVLIANIGSAVSTCNVMECISSFAGIISDLVVPLNGTSIL